MGVIHNLGQDLRYVRGVYRALRVVTPMARRRTRTFPDAVEDLARLHGERPALLSERESLTFAGYDRRANRYARWALSNGVGKGDVVCLLMSNRPEYVAIWLGVVRAGGVVALLNTNLRGAALAHCINIVRPRHIIVADDLRMAYDSAAPLLEAGPLVWGHGEAGPDGLRIDTAIAALDDGPLPPSDRPALTLDDPCLYIYTSGTTGLPKAAHINHYRVYGAMLAFSRFMEATKDDRIYNCLPLYHTSGGVLGIGSALVAGGSVFIREKFSVSQFWDDAVAQDCTRFQYIGELCRYLLNAPPHARERAHRISIACGNGLRPDIWDAFRERFGIAHVREFYAATEGNAILFNFDDTAGSVGRIPRWARSIFPVTTVRYDIERETVIRGQDGLCVECAEGEVGELVSQIVINPLKPSQRFDGYADRIETEKKILRDVFVPGDMWFRSGDLMRRDRRGYYFFVDRIGDTFRWKGENISTSEVAEALGACPGVAEVAVYGVAISGVEGRAGMATVVPGEGFDLGVLRERMHQGLSPHARPLFIRVGAMLDATTTFKQRKIDLVRQGCDPGATADPIFFDDVAAGHFVRMDPALHLRLGSGGIRL
jgi:fatty-acyl-CoA synthase